MFMLGQPAPDLLKLLQSMIFTAKSKSMSHHRHQIAYHHAAQIQQRNWSVSQYIRTETTFSKNQILKVNKTPTW